MASRVVKLGIGLGVGTAAVLALTWSFLPRLFTPDQTVLAAMAVIFPWYGLFPCSGYLTADANVALQTLTASTREDYPSLPPAGILT